MACVAFAEMFDSPTQRTHDLGARQTDRRSTIRTITKRQHAGLLGLFCLGVLSSFSAEPSGDSAPGTAELAWLDTLHSRTSAGLQGQVTRIDQYFAESEEARLDTRGSTFKLQLELKFEDDDGLNVEFSPHFRANLVVPNLEKRWKIFLTTLAPDDLPDVSVNSVDADENSGVFFGMSREFFRTLNSLIDASVGIKWRWPPKPYAKTDYKYRLVGEHWMVFPRQRLFWIIDDGFGETTSLRLEYWLNDSWVTRSDAALTYSESSRGFEWAQVFSAKYIIQGKERDNRHAIGLRLGATGHYEHSHGQTDDYFLTLPYRRTFLREWMFLNLVPGLEYRMDDDTTPDAEDRWVPSFRIGVDILFAGDAH